MKGVIKTTDRQTQQHLKQLHVHCTTPHKHTSASSSPSKTLHAHITSITKKRDKDTLKHKRNLAQAFRTTPDGQRTGLSNRYLKQAARNMALYSSSGSKQRRLRGTSLITMPLRSPASLSNPRNSFFSQSVNRRFLEVTGKDNLTVFSCSGRVKSPEWRWQLKRADLRHLDLQA